ncbi:MAG TPA: DUF2911 domain-containing protein [Bacteroidetes bacterium]|nr:DUF2911 domain-containing protein [Bacteroidota bacterium]
MKKVFPLLLAFLLTCPLLEAQNIKTPPASKKAAVVEYIGLTKVAVYYSRPGVKGREGKIYGKGGLVPYNGGTPFPWRAGANENTVMYFADDVTINGNALPAGKYGFHIIPSENEWTLIFSKDHDSWGSFFYNADNDALRVNVKPESCELTEWLSYDFVNQTDESADIRLRWEKKQVSFTVGVDVHAVTMAGIEKSLMGLDGFNPRSYAAAAQYCLSADKDLNKALAWSDKSIDPNSGGQKTFQTLSTRYQILDKMGKTAEAKTAMKEALDMGNMGELHFFARSFIQKGQPEMAMKIFKMNKERHPDDQFTTVVGMARGNMAIGEYNTAAKHFKMAAENAPPGQAGFYNNLAKQCEEKAQKGG